MQGNKIKYVEKIDLIQKYFKEQQKNYEQNLFKWNKIYVYIYLSMYKYD